MFENDNLDGNEIHLPIGMDPFHFLLRQLEGEPGDNINYHKWKMAYTPCLKFAIQYDFNKTVLIGLLYDFSLDDPLDKRIEAFALASKIDHVLSACRLILMAGSGEEVGSKGESLRPNSGEWTKSDIASVSTTWLWALTCAVTAVDASRKLQADSDRSGRDYWVSVVGEFMSYLSECE